MAIIPECYLNSVVAIGVKNDNNEECWVGSGFIVSRREKDNALNVSYYVITNKHVVKKYKNVFIRFKCFRYGFCKRL